MPSLNFLSNHFHHLVNLEQLTLKSDEMGPNYLLEEIDFTPRLVTLLQQLPSPQHLKTLILETYGTAYKPTENLKSSLQKLENIESFFIYGNYFEPAIQDIFCTTLRALTSLKRVHINFSYFGGESLFHISKILENNHINEFNTEAPSNILFKLYNHPNADITYIRQRVSNNLKGIKNNFNITNIATNLIPSAQTQEMMNRNRYILGGKFYSHNMNHYIQFFHQGIPLTESKLHAISNLDRADKCLLFY